MDRRLPEPYDMEPGIGIKPDFDLHDNRGNAPDDRTSNHISASKFVLQFH